MARLTAQQRSELVQLHLQGESIDAIVRQTGHARTTVLRWVRGFTVAGSLSDRTRSGRPVTVMTPTVVGRIKQLAKAKRGCRSRSTRQVAATLSSRGTLISQTSVCRALDSKGVKPYVQPQVPLQRYGDKQRRLRFAAEQKERDWRCCVFADEKTFVCNPRPNRRNDVIWTDDPSTIEPIVRVAHSVSINTFGAFSASGKSRLFFFSEKLTAPLYVSILESTVLPARLVPWRTLDLFTRQRSEAHCEIDARLVARQCARIYHAGAVATALTSTSTPIENAWALVARQASLRQPKTLEELRHAVGVAWTEVMTEEYCTTLADSMDARLRKLRKLRGAHTGY